MAINSFIKVMETKFVVITVIVLLGLLIFIPENTISFMKKRNVYRDAYDLGKRYLDISKKSNYYGLNYPAVMFDIDDTLISYSGKEIKEIINLLKKCISMGLIVLIVTARPEESREYTIQQLDHFGIKYGALFLRSSNDDFNTFKSKIKQQLAEQNDIVTIMSIGDNIIDVNGEYSGYWIKLPNHTDKALYHLNASGAPEEII
jgi:hypothetical protein